MNETTPSRDARATITRWVMTVLMAGVAASGCKEAPNKKFMVHSSKTVDIDLSGTSGPLQIRLESGNIVVTSDPNVESMQMEVIYNCRGSDREAVKSRTSSMEIEVEQTGGGLKLTEGNTAGKGFEDSVDVTIRFPVSKAFDLQIKVDTGDIRIQGISGTMKLQGIDGNMKVENSTGEMTLFTRTGNLSVLDSRGTLTANTHDGNMTIREHSGEGIRATCVAGTIDIELARDGLGPLIVDTTTGRIYLTVGSEFDGTLNLGARRGKILVEDPGARILESNVENKGERSLVIGDDGPISSLGTSSGSIAVRILPPNPTPGLDKSPS